MPKFKILHNLKIFNKIYNIFLFQIYKTSLSLNVLHFYSVSCSQGLRIKPNITAERNKIMQSYYCYPQLLKALVQF